MTIPRGRMLLVGVIVPLALAAIGIAVILVSIPELPNPVAVHWGLTDGPDRFGNIAVPLLLITVPTLAHCALSLAVTRYSKDGIFTAIQRFVLAMAPFLAAVLTASMAGSIIIQRGLPDASAAPSIASVLGIAIGSGVLLGLAGWLVLPTPTPRAEAASIAAPTVELTSTERATWTQRIGPNRTVTGSLAVFAVLAVVAGTATMAVAAPLWASVVFLALALVLAVGVGGSMFWRITVDGRGLDARAAIGFPHLRVPLDEIDAATVTNVRVGRDFGGWGLRWGGAGRYGVITRSGEALVITRTRGRTLTLTVPGAGTAAALLISLRERLSSGSTRS